MKKSEGLQCQPYVSTIRVSFQHIGGESMGKKSKMDKKAAARIQSSTDRTGKSKDFAKRAQSAADKSAAKSKK